MYLLYAERYICGFMRGRIDAATPRRRAAAFIQKHSFRFLAAQGRSLSRSRRRWKRRRINFKPRIEFARRQTPRVTSPRNASGGLRLFASARLVGLATLDLSFISTSFALNRHVTG